jgi:hypothetical protein
VQVGGAPAQEGPGPTFTVALEEPARVVVSRAGFKDWARVLDPGAADAGELRVTLEPLRPPVRVRVTSSPSGASVWLNGVEQRGTTPLTVPEVLPDERGQVRVRVARQGLKPYEDVLTPRAGAVSVMAELRR